MITSSPPTKNKPTKLNCRKYNFHFFLEKNWALCLQCPFIWIQNFTESWNSLIHEKLRPLLTGIAYVNKLVLRVSSGIVLNSLLAAVLCVNGGSLEVGGGVGGQGGWCMRTISLAGLIFLFEKDPCPNVTYIVLLELSWMMMKYAGKISKSLVCRARCWPLSFRCCHWERRWCLPLVCKMAPLALANVLSFFRLLKFHTSYHSFSVSRECRAFYSLMSICELDPWNLSSTLSF